MGCCRQVPRLPEEPLMGKPGKGCAFHSHRVDPACSSRAERYGMSACCIECDADAFTNKAVVHQAATE